MAGYSSCNRWLALALCTLAVGLAAACGGATDNADSTGRSAGGAGTTTESKANSDAIAAAPAAGDEASRSAGVTTGTAAGGLPLPSQIDRKIVRVATISLATDSVSENFENIGNIAASVGGYVSSSTFGRTDDQQTASVTIKVPSDSYQDVVARLRGLGDVRSEESNANDVSEEHSDLSARLRNLKATELQYLEFLKRAEDIGTVLQVQDRINATRLEIEQVQGRIDLLDNISSLATITVHLAPPAVAPAAPHDGSNNPLEVAADAFDASLVVLLGIATVALAVGAFSWWLLPLIAGGVYVARRAMREQRQAAPPAPPAV